MTASDIDAYIRGFPPEARAILEKVRATIREAAPNATEMLSYRMPAFKGHRMLVYYAALQEHIGLYPPVTGDAALVKAAARYAGPKGNLQFPLADPIPYGLIARIVRVRVKEDAARAAAQGKPGARAKKQR